MAHLLDIVTTSLGKIHASLQELHRKIDNLSLTQSVSDAPTFLNWHPCDSAESVLLLVARIESDEKFRGNLVSLTL